LELMNVELTGVDLALIGILSFSAIVSLLRGFFKEALSLVTWIAAFFLAKSFAPSLSVELEAFIQSPAARYGAAFAILFGLTLLIGGVINSLISKVIHIAGLGIADRILGTVFGVARGIILITVGVLILGKTPVTQADLWQQSSLLPHFQLLATWSEKVLPELSRQLMPLEQLQNLQTFQDLKQFQDLQQHSSLQSIDSTLKEPDEE
jgi:membrane protein required for colicin V production